MTVEEIRLQNLLALVADFGSAAEVARRADTSASYLSQIITRVPSRTGKARDVGAKLARKLEAACGKHEGWLDVAHTGEIQSSNAPVKPQSFAPSNVSKAPPRPVTTWDNEDELDPANYVFIPRLNVQAACGTAGKVMWEIDEKGQRNAFRRGWAERIGINPASCATIVAEGDSMEERIHEGDSLVVDCSQKTILHDKIYALCWRGEFYVKQLKKLSGGGLQLYSTNRNRDDIDIAPDHLDELEIIGRVIAVSGAL
ncbi:S24 family peptidase [Chitinolyticbacter meiyuanensis]|uniref:S24 family peptidase n=1 Tax=Chitinolyticbacter meiyuanensis TaxID=682798 RepID=UPI0011E5FFAC|nr:S24 family peptidase [Chitinolyticbacter meiyuanensis]